MTFQEGERIEVTDKCCVDEWIGEQGVVVYGNKYVTTVCMDNVTHHKSRILNLSNNSLKPIKSKTPLPDR